MIVARQEYTVALGKVDEALAWLREVQGWESYRLIYPRGCRVFATSVGRLYKVVVEAEYDSLLDRLACLRTAMRRPEYASWRARMGRYCLDVYGAYDHPSAGEAAQALDQALV